MKPIVTDTYDFPTLIERGYVYVDKTALLRRLVSGVDGLMFFMSRPRRFGKSLMISTLEQIFKGNRKLFKGLAIDKTDYDWQVYPVIRLDMSVLDPIVGAEGVCNDLCILLAHQMELAGLKVPEASSPGMLMGLLIEELAAQSAVGKVVVLVDEYDNPISGLLGRPKELDAMQQTLQHFYQVFKAKAGKIRFLMMTGVSKFTKLSVFSGLNNLTDLSMRSEYAGLLGYTEAELKKFFAPQVKAFAAEKKTSARAIIGELLSWYDSYRFSPQSDVRVCNPVSVGSALTQRRFCGYWDRTGSPTLILERLRAAGCLPSELDDLDVPGSVMDACDPYDLPFAALMYQAGYLTIRGTPCEGMLRLGIPNREVRESLYGGFLSQLLKGSAGRFQGLASSFVAELEGDPQASAERVLRSVFAMVPHEWKLKSEAEAKRYFLLFMRMAGAQINAEVESAKGRADAILETTKAIYIFEFKYGKSAKAALEQCRARDYAAPYQADGRKIAYVGVHYGPSKKTIDVLSEPVNEPVNRLAEPVNSPEDLLRLIVSRPGLRKPELAVLSGKSVATLKRYLERIGTAVEFRGAPKTGGYYPLRGGKRGMRDESEG